MAIDSSIPPLRCLFFLPLFDDRETEIAEDEVGLAGCFSTAELFGLQDAADGIAAGQSDDSFRSVSFAFENQFVTSRTSERMIHSSIEVGQRSKNVFPRQSGWDGLEVSEKESEAS